MQMMVMMMQSKSKMRSTLSKGTPYLTRNIETHYAEYPS